MDDAVLVLAAVFLSFAMGAALGAFLASAGPAGMNDR